MRTQAPPPATASERAAMQRAEPCRICGERPFVTAGGRLDVVHNFRLHYPERCRPIGEVRTVSEDRAARDYYDPEARRA